MLFGALKSHIQRKARGLAVSFLPVIGKIIFPGVCGQSSLFPVGGATGRVKIRDQDSF